MGRPAHNDRRIARRVALGEPAAGPDANAVWVHTTPEEMAAATLAGFPIIAEGWGLRPELVAPIIDSPRRMIVMVPTEEFRLRQVRELPRAATFGHDVDDPVRAQQNRLARDRLVAEDAVRKARQLGMHVIEVNGSLDAEGVAAIIADRFAEYLA